MDLASYKAGNNLKTFVLVAALTGLLVAIGYLIGGASGLVVFAAIAVVFNFVMYWFSGKIALKMSQGRPGERAGGARAPPDHRPPRHSARACRSPPST